jgi:hypothetical protein
VLQHVCGLTGDCLQVLAINYVPYGGGEDDRPSGTRFSKLHWVFRGAARLLPLVVWWYEVQNGKAPGSLKTLLPKYAGLFAANVYFATWMMHQSFDSANETEGWAPIAKRMVTGPAIGEPDTPAPLRGPPAQRVGGRGGWVGGRGGWSLTRGGRPRSGRRGRRCVLRRRFAGHFQRAQAADGTPQGRPADGRRRARGAPSPGERREKGGGGGEKR